MKIVKPGLSELQAVIDLWIDQYDYHHEIDSEYYVPVTEKLKKEFSAYLESAISAGTPRILVSKKEEHIIGFITFELSNADYFDAAIKQYGSVIELFVHKDYRREGVGKSLMNEVEDYFRQQGISHIELQCSSFNDIALDFYQKSGYKNSQTLLIKKL
ncbi:GNAT family N-acetyltransferase [Candidatus Dojkabacteria bacterium]|uniref:GNAT family N-acetyltransferase n=1 Tax=Candidatus Dojkabacteria bacterium TaxID=2099670 RepID=A0A955L6A5_9BACT|nr:GNAT family N-acetyltransferase [Candidatus Dojkabacteria bacterium]